MAEPSISPAAEVKAQLAELVRIEHLKMHKSDKFRWSDFLQRSDRRS